MSMKKLKNLMRAAAGAVIVAGATPAPAQGQAVDDGAPIPAQPLAPGETIDVPEYTIEDERVFDEFIRNHLLRFHPDFGTPEGNYAKSFADAVRVYNAITEDLAVNADFRVNMMVNGRREIFANHYLPDLLRQRYPDVAVETGTTHHIDLE